MAKTLKQLRAQNEKLTKQIQAKGELKKLEEEGIRLGRQNKKLLTELRRSPTEKAVLRALNTGGKDLVRGSKIAGKGVFKGAKSIGSGLMRYGRFLNEEQDKIDRARGKIRKPKREKTSKRRKIIKRRKK